MQQLEIVYLNPNSLKPRSNNPRTHTHAQIRQIARSIEAFGFLNPVLIDANQSIVVGHARVAAAKLEKLAHVPTVRVDHLTSEQIRAYVIADNRLAEKAGWNEELLALEFLELEELEFEVALTGFETAEIDLMVGEAHKGEIEAEPSPVDRNRPTVTRTGDLWIVGEHRLMCGNSLDSHCFDTLLGPKRAQMIFTDPPYNVPIQGHVSGLGKVKHGEFAMGSGEMSLPEFTAFLKSSFAHIANYAADGSIHFICMDWRHVREVLDAADGTYSELKNLCVWAKTNAGTGSLYRSQHEFVFVFKKGQKPHINNVELGQFGRNRTNLWTYAGVNTFGKDRDAELAMHPTVKPLQMVMDAILDCSERGGLILDPFAGSGTTLAAAENTGRAGYGIELDPHFVDVAIKRLSTATGIAAVISGSGNTFEQLAAERGIRSETND